MQNYTQDFQLTPGQIWLNAASEGPIPTVSAKALHEVIGWKLSPQFLTIPKFIEVPVALKTSLSKLLQVEAKDIILGNSATYGIHLLSNGLEFNAGDQILLMQNDFPTDILPWLHLKAKGVDVVQLKAKNIVLTPVEVEQAITPKTKLVCLPHVHSFSGWSLDIKTIGDICRQRNIIFVLNVSQSLGAMPTDVRQLSVDAIVSAGYKWLLGPYGTGFCWMTESLRQQLKYPQAYWISVMDEHSINSEDAITLPEGNNARKYDIFGTANFFNYVPWKASIDYLLGIGIDNVWKHQQALITRMHRSIDKDVFDIKSPALNDVLTPIVVISHKDVSRNKNIHEALKMNGVHIALWKNALRISAHLYNTESDIERLITLLNEQA